MRGAGWYSDVVGTERPEWLVLAVRRHAHRPRVGRDGARRSADMAERDSLLGRYALESRAKQPPGDAELVVLQRAR